MSLKKKIVLSFFISASIIVVLVIFAYATFVEIRKEIRYLELADTIRSKSLQLRRHEKNFFLYRDPKEIGAVHEYMRELEEILRQGSPFDNREKLQSLRKIIEEYKEGFDRIEIMLSEFQKEFDRLKTSYPQYSSFVPLIESTSLEQPLLNAKLLERTFSMRSGDPAILILKGLDSEIGDLRKNGEDLLIISKDLDKSARERVEMSIGLLQNAAFILFPLFFVVGLAAMSAVIHSIVKRLKILTLALEKTGAGDFSSLSIPGMQDEVGSLIDAFNKMETDLTQRDIELHRKNEELLQSRKLASIGTLASGVAHELNNPLNNIYISAQILEREAGEGCPPTVKEIVNDIVGQTKRMKQIVGDLLEFARGREPRPREIDLNELIMGAYKLVSTAVDTGAIRLSIDTDPNGVIIEADPEQVERVFINLFTNAVDAMSGAGDLGVKVMKGKEAVKVKVSDTGKGMPADKTEKIFEPFYTMRDRGTGLGLAIVFSIIKKHEGEIEVESEVGKGTTFTITLPVKHLSATDEH